MRKTLTALVVILAAGSLAACDNLPWSKPKDPPAAVTSDTTTPDPTATAVAPPTDPAAPADVSKPADQTASVDPAKPAGPEKTPAQPTPTTK